MWFGARPVARKSFTAALASGESLMFVPGGTAEMRLWSPPMHNDQGRVRLVRQHTGFVRLALERAAATGRPVNLVPVYSPHENDVLSNVRAPVTQRYFEKRIGFPFPYFPWGRWGLPIPRRVRLEMFIGRPVTAERRSGETAQESLRRTAQSYYRELERCAKRAEREGNGGFVWADEEEEKNLMKGE